MAQELELVSVPFAITVRCPAQATGPVAVKILAINDFHGHLASQPFNNSLVAWFEANSPIAPGPLDRIRRVN